MKVVAQDALVQGPCVLGQPQGAERPLPLGQVGGVDRRVADGHRRSFRIDVDRRDVAPEFGPAFQSRNLHTP